MLKVSVSMMKKLSQDGLVSLPADTISMSPARNQGVKLELDVPTVHPNLIPTYVHCVEVLLVRLDM